MEDKKVCEYCGTPLNENAYNAGGLWACEDCYYQTKLIMSSRVYSALLGIHFNSNLEEEVFKECFIEYMDEIRHVTVSPDWDFSKRRM